ncbi:hypothetical protein BS50DRAFT_346048 [Corynespora cassiicola Philippines]|uniref:Uncharacterized protein n=1 Tax=Corynespora cassiicola Philippines TaxID=1448308 RepID=A0A2T2NQE7_CORCC|nr:hypothetical protein BS50DRAFT_346048 [Corynespora cassiicola Philippines]
MEAISNHFAFPDIHFSNRLHGEFSPRTANCVFCLEKKKKKKKKKRLWGNYAAIDGYGTTRLPPRKCPAGQCERVISRACYAIDLDERTGPMYVCASCTVDAGTARPVRPTDRPLPGTCWGGEKNSDALGDERGPRHRWLGEMAGREGGGKVKFCGTGASFFWPRVWCGVVRVVEPSPRNGAAAHGRRQSQRQSRAEQGMTRN